MIFDFLLSRDLERRLRFAKSSHKTSHSKHGLLEHQDAISLHNLHFSSQKQIELESRIIIDCLSIISIHILTQKSANEAAESVLLTKIARSVDLTDFILSLLQLPCPAIAANPVDTRTKEDLLSEVREYALKFLQMLLFLSDDFREVFEAKGSFATLIDLAVE